MTAFYILNQYLCAILVDVCTETTSIAYYQSLREEFVVVMATVCQVIFTALSASSILVPNLDVFTILPQIYSFIYVVFAIHELLIVFHVYHHMHFSGHLISPYHGSSVELECWEGLKLGTVCVDVITHYTTVNRLHATRVLSGPREIISFLSFFFTYRKVLIDPWDRAIHYFLFFHFSSLKATRPELCLDAHDSTTNTLQKSPFLNDVFLTVGGWTFSLWKDGVTVWTN